MPSWLSDLVGADLPPLASWVLAGAIVIVVMVVVISVAKKLLAGSIGPRARGKGPRLAVLDVAQIDQRRKLVLVRRDDMEHLILIGGQNDVVVESSIMRASQVGRQRGEPSLRSEPALPDMADRAAPRAAARPTQQRPAPSNSEGSRAASPLARPMPRPSVPASPQARPVQEPAALDASAIDPVSPPSRTAPEVLPPATSRVPPVTIESVANERREPSNTEPEPRPAERLSPVVEPVARQVQPVPPVAAPAPPVGAALPVGGAIASSPERRDSRPPTPTPAEAAPIVAPAPAAERAPERAFVMPPRLPASLPSSNTPEPVLRRATPVAPPAVQPRSMATPTIPVKPAAEEPEAIEPAPEETKVAPTWANASTLVQNVPPPSFPTPAAATPHPAFRGAVPPFTVQMTPKPLDPQPARPAAMAIDEPETASSIDRETEKAVIVPDEPSSPAPAIVPPAPARPAAPSAPPINLSNLLGARAVPAPPIVGSAVPASAPPPSAKTDAADMKPEDDRSEIAQSEGLVLSKPVFPVLGGANEASEKRPLSVRSFATTIQSRKNGDAPQPRVEPIAPPVPVVPMTAPPVRVPPVPVPLTPLPETARPAPKPEADDGESLEDFLSAELDSDFGKQNWQDEETAAPSKATAVQPLEKTPPRTLTLEEEMERLLGDFDFDVSDRKKL